MTQLITPASPVLPSRRNWLKGLGAVLGTRLLAAPATLLAAPAPAADAAPVATNATPEAVSALAGGDEYIGMVKLLAGTTLPMGWARCDGRVLPVAEHPALFALLGATYGGDGRHTFALPNLGAPAAAEAGAAMQLAIKAANGPATTTALAELRLVHQRRPRARVA